MPTSRLIWCGLLCVAGALAQRNVQPVRPPEKYPTVLARLDAMSAIPLTQWMAHADIPHGEDPSLDDSAWTKVTLTGGRGQQGQGQSAGMAWYRATFTVPAAVGGMDIRGATLKLMPRFSNDGRVFVNGGLVAQGEGRTLDPILLTNRAAAGQKYVIAVKVPFHAATGRFQGAQIHVEYNQSTDPAVLRSEIQSAEDLINGSPAAAAEHQPQLDNAVKAIDLPALDRGDSVAFSRSLDAAAHGLAPIKDWDSQYTIRLVGNSHIDMAWLWPWTETVEVVRDTFTTALQLMREYPGFTYAQSSVQDYDWLREKYPAEFREIQQRVKEGRWELVGGMWVEPDLNMPDGEGLVRQLLVGTRFFKKYFDKDTTIGWNPDSFGYSWQLPQIYKKSGFDTFVTQKMSWNETTAFPHKLFWWESPDGSRVLTYFPHGYSGGINPVSLSQDVADYSAQTKFPEIMHLYGVGDHGGGPTRQMLDEAMKMQSPSATYPKTVFSTARQFFDDVETRIKTGGLQVPVWKDEMYLQYHRGCYTTQSETKRLIRHNEELLQNAEKFASLAFVNAKRPYSNEEFESIWKRVLFDHFHDIMPGSGIGINYADADRNLEDASLRSEKILDGALDDLSAGIDTAGAGTPVVVYNSLSWDRTAPVSFEVHAPAAGQHLEVRDSSGQPLPSQVISSDGPRLTVQAIAKNVPSMGYEVLHVVSAANARPAASALKVNGTEVENEFLRMKIDAKTGCITSLINKADGKDAVAAGGCGNLLQAFKDVPRTQDAWEIRFDQDEWDLKQPKEVKVVENGPDRVVVRISHTFRAPNHPDRPDSVIQQDVTVYAGVPRVDVRTRVDWQEEHVLLKAAFPVSVQATKATFEIPYGTIERPTTRNTPEEKAMFEVPAIRWGDISDASHGFSLLNASKYGYDAVGNLIRLSLLRSPQMPAPDNHIADQGLHEFTYALYAHAGDWKAGNTMRQGYELNYPLIATVTQGHAGSLPARHSWARVEPGNVILTVMKKAEDDDSVVFRFYEFEGKPARVKLQLPRKAASAVETNLMEKRGAELGLAADGMSVTVPAGPYEIKTVAVTFPK
ncbi:MAG TPA: glycoside hydrolase family 38 C-terminal domain-containing protein [Candidatus Sulfopaludibacter sp.]|jgi:alpha-mannosidase|nr:glycoside hydrolase family 38 C-terminal domain-containing protein [Candidatus Sulfopaludibacter sp.]